MCDVRDRGWRDRIAALTEFKTRFGHCDVPPPLARK
jgi:hypothetical protein